ncbi:hypothetical protein [Streptomyces tropicalis]|uniref:Secreted protein n=1 Tax=Streptomyces tropicalis TaxID=3034234 RepID=A0ABT6AC89_9ACTN|nr:hypothetical protein [Streptomyces tropicalis]MDF3302263.1 hypothetical protein [Streptomyces tropicalis]
MSTAPPARRAARRHAWLRMLVLLLALLVPGVHAGAHPAGVAAVAGQAGDGTAEQDVLDAVLRPAVRTAERSAGPLRPAPLPDAAPPAGADPRAAGPSRPACVPHALRRVVLRC